MMMVQRSQGKLIEVVYAEPLTADDLTAFTLEIRRLVGQAKEPLVFITDWRCVTGMFTKPIADTIVWIMRRDNPMLGFNACLVSPGNVPFRRQVEDILVQSQNPKRKCFTTEISLTAAVDPLLDETERLRLREFLRLNAPGPSSGATGGPSSGPASGPRSGPPAGPRSIPPSGKR
ncbi:MAG: hypothetical protein U0441_33825 [Polyangiaceae bacterium]